MEKEKLPVNWRLFWIGLGLLIVGYFLLWKGFTAFPPFAIVGGYIVIGISLIPKKEVYTKNENIPKDTKRHRKNNK